MPGAQGGPKALPLTIDIPLDLGNQFITFVNFCYDPNVALPEEPDLAIAFFFVATVYHAVRRSDTDYAAFPAWNAPGSRLHHHGGYGPPGTMNPSEKSSICDDKNRAEEMEKAKGKRVYCEGFGFAARGLAAPA
jgi:hypothetical protein